MDRGEGGAGIFNLVKQSQLVGGHECGLMRQ